MRTPTEKQYRLLLGIGSGAAALSRTKRETEPFLKHGWVTADFDGRYYQWIRITPDGLRALAEAVARYGLPEIGPKPTTRIRVCAECGGTRYRFEDKPVPVPPLERE